MSAGRENKEVVPLQTITISRLFKKWGLDITREITSNNSKQHKYISISINYFTKWAEAIPMTRE
jgi:hypothetical protein